jgi:hypothetical protein
MGMAAFQRAFGLPLQLYAPYFCNDTVYTTNFSMVRSDPSLPECSGFDFWDPAPEDAVAFYEFLYDLGTSYGMFSYEPDFLNSNHNCVPRFISEIGAAETVFRAQTDVALQRGIPVQWCYATPYTMLWTLTASGTCGQWVMSVALDRRLTLVPVLRLLPFFTHQRLSPSR